MAWIPLQHRETVLMMQEIIVSCIKTTVPSRFGLTKVDQRKNEGRGLGHCGCGHAQVVWVAQSVA